MMVHLRTVVLELSQSAVVLEMSQSAVETMTKKPVSQTNILISCTVHVCLCSV